MQKLEELLQELLFNDKARGISKKIGDKHKKFLRLFITYLDERNVTYIDDVTPKKIRGFMATKTRRRMC